ncbi:hypothetical protein M0R45_016075 [Rubus argutus]|uniref:Uncharacterized protein n=1 Tax=Rubus argutus TaxID=59490 RepID=A0AAW1XSG3_RUBAR
MQSPGLWPLEADELVCGGSDWTLSLIKLSASRLESVLEKSDLEKSGEEEMQTGSGGGDEGYWSSSREMDEILGKVGNRGIGIFTAGSGFF